MSKRSSSRDSSLSLPVIVFMLVAAVLLSGMASTTPQTPSTPSPSSTQLDQATRERPYLEKENELIRAIQTERYADARRLLIDARRIMEVEPAEPGAGEARDSYRDRLNALEQYLAQRERQHQRDQANRRRIDALSDQQQRRQEQRQAVQNQTRSLLEQANDLWKRRYYPEAARLVRRIRTLDPACREAQHLENILAGYVAADRSNSESSLAAKASDRNRVSASPSRGESFVGYPDARKWSLISRRTPLSPPGEDEAERKTLGRENQVISQLARTIAKVHFAEGTTLAQMVNWFQNQGQLDVVPHWRVLEDWRITPDTELSAPLSLHDVTLETVLNMVLSVLSPRDPDGRLDWDFPAGVVVISTRQDLHDADNRYATRTKVYDVSDLLHEPPRGSLPGLGGDNWGGMGMMGSPFGSSMMNQQPGGGGIGTGMNTGYFPNAGGTGMVVGRMAY